MQNLYKNFFQFFYSVQYLFDYQIKTIYSII